MTVCSGVGAPEVAAPWIDWRWQSEIERFPCAVLAHRFPSARNLGDMTRFQEWPDATVDVLCGGTPCQSFSVAGLRAGLADPRGKLALTYLAIARRYRPRWLVWENVSGVLSSNEGRDFGAFVAGLAELGYHAAWRVLDAQHFGVAQRRRRVFVVGHSGDWTRAAAVLFERESLQRHPPPRPKEGQRIALTISARPTGGGGLGTDFDCDGGLIAAELAPTLNAHYGTKQGLENQHIDGGCGLFVAQAFDWQSGGESRGLELKPTAQLQASQVPAVAFDTYNQLTGDVTQTLRSGTADSRPAMLAGAAVRRLTPRECERLQGFPDDYTAIPYRGKPADQCPDGPRYKALGNSMAVPVMQWIFDRIRMVDEMEHANA